MSPGSAADYQKDEQAGVTRLNWPHSSRRAGRCHAAQLAIIKKMNRQVSLDSAVDYQKNEQAGVTRLTWSQSIRRAGRCRGAQLVYIKQMSRHLSCGSVFIIKQMNWQVSRGSAGHSQADEQAGVTRLSWRISSR